MCYVDDDYFIEEIKFKFHFCSLVNVSALVLIINKHDDILFPMLVTDELTIGLIEILYTLHYFTPCQRCEVSVICG